MHNMPEKLSDPQVMDIFDQAKKDALSKSRKKVMVEGKKIEICKPFPSPTDWRDTWIYFLMVDRFNNPDAPPIHTYDGPIGTFQGGKIKGVQNQLPYLQDLGVKAIWLSPVLRNRQSDNYSYHGYGIQDFLHIDPRFGNEDDLISLVDEAHAREMYVIMDIVLNHAGDVFAYRGYGSEAPHSDREYDIEWRDERGNPAWSIMPIDETVPANAAVFPDELRENLVFRRRGIGGEDGGDFCSLKELITEKEEFFPWHHFPVRDVLIRAYQYWIAKTDIDGYRIDTLKYIKPEFARIFGNAMREYALSIGKKNFFAFGEVFDNEEKIREFIGKDSSKPGQPVGVDSALDFPLFFNLPSMIKGMIPPSNIVGMYQNRLEKQKGLLSSHGEAGQFFVTFLDNHDMRSRFYYQDPGDIHRFDDQVSMAIACLFSLQGIPCLYYGTEQGLHGSGDIDSFVREALWGKLPEFDRNHPFYQTIKEIASLRDSQPALRYGRQYFRPISGNGMEFGISTFQQGVLAFSRILNDTEIVVALNTHTSESWQGEIIVDFALNPVSPAATSYQVLFSNQNSSDTTTVQERYGGTVTIHETKGGITNGPIKTLPVSLQPMEVKILGKMG